MVNWRGLWIFIESRVIKPLSYVVRYQLNYAEQYVKTDVMRGNQSADLILIVSRCTPNNASDLNDIFVEKVYVSKLSNEVHDGL